MPKMHARPKRRGRQSLEEQVEQLARIVRGSKHLMVYTGAGISTSAGIPDYRGPAGVWTLKAQGKRPPPVAYTQVCPSYAHRALSLLVQAGLVKHVVTQNVDGLHRASGVPGGKLSELHGNARMERCEECGREYLRDYATWSVTAGAGSSSASARAAKRRRSSERTLPSEYRAHASEKCSSSEPPIPPSESPPPSDQFSPSDGGSTSSSSQPSEAWAHASGKCSTSDRPIPPFPKPPPSNRFPPSERPSTFCNSQPLNGVTPPNKTEPFNNSQPSGDARPSDCSSPSAQSAQFSTPYPSAQSPHSFSLRPCDHSHPSDHSPRSGRSSPFDHFHLSPSDCCPSSATYRRCESSGCAGFLRHCVILFGEPLPDSAVCSAESETALADAALVLGSSLRVGPACDYPADVAASGGKLAIVNLQPTPLDARADVVIRGACDQVMELLLSKLHLDIGLSCGIHELTREPCKSQKTGKPSWGPTDCRELTLFLVPHASA